jgi:hypothetical protein
LIVGDEEKRDANFALERFQFALHLLAQVRVQCGEWLVQKQQLWAVHQRSGQRDALLLAAAQLRGPGLGELIHLDHAQRFDHAAANFILRGALDAKPVGHVVLHAQMREERVMLKHRVDPAPVSRQGVEAFSAHPEFAGSGLFESGDQPQQGGFAGAALAKKRKEFARGNIQRNFLEYFAWPKTLGHRANFKERCASNTRILHRDRAGGAHCAFFTSFQISVYFGRRGTSCQK